MILMATVHDPSGQLLSSCDGLGEKLQQLFSEVYLCVSDVTHQEVIHQVSNQFKRVKVIPKNGAADARRQVLSYALTTKQSPCNLMYCDFDRVITWLNTNPEELHQLVNHKEKIDYMIVGRTDKAFSTHPLSWQETERVTNFVASKFFDIENLDVTAGAAILSDEVGKIINSQSIHTHTDCEWPKLVVDNGGILSHIKVDGLSFDTVNVSNITSHDHETERLKLSLNILAVFH